ncbi:hypothetical protein Goshw_027124 [Gossypium schwendimanii]|uniref:Uncharacterized protein n=1 Tax=Gossypium schwendimanii TaxID=34291 RepID=A0A7J9M805_GOSSC|nr:hypothetical protein [Gossypium schwendimanii]
MALGSETREMVGLDGNVEYPFGVYFLALIVVAFVFPRTLLTLEKTKIPVGNALVLTSPHPTLNSLTLIFSKIMRYMNESGAIKDAENVLPNVTNPERYDLQMGNLNNFGTHFFYGGPGYSDKCL